MVNKGDVVNGDGGALAQGFAAEARRDGEYDALPGGADPREIAQALAEMAARREAAEAGLQYQDR